MKKILLAFVAVFSMSTAFSQLADGSTAPDFTLTDINGNEFTLSEALAQGKTVIIDFSATWCGPCWGYHNSGSMEALYEEHGPNGTCSEDFVVLYIEGDTQTTLADLEGTGNNTQGNWVQGTGYPIFNPTAGDVMDDYQIQYFPTIYKICPDGIINEIGQASLDTFVSQSEDCYDSNDMKINATSGLVCSGTFNPTLTVQNRNFTTLTSATIHYSVDGGAEQTFNWSGSLSAGQSELVELPSVTLAGGEHTFEFSAVSPNGIEDSYGSNNCKKATYNVNTATALAVPYAQNFMTPTFPYANWIIDNPDGGISWARVGTNQGSLKYDCFTYTAAGAQDRFIPEPFNLSGLNDASLNFKVAHKRYSTQYTDGLRVEVSSDCGATWTEVFFKQGDALATGAASTSAFTPGANDWRTECVDLASYAGSDKLFVRFTGINGYGNNIYVDDINVSDAECIVNIAENTGDNTNMVIYPNPANDIANVNFSIAENADVVIEVVSLVGQKVVSVNKGNLAAGNYIHQLDVQNLNAGIYLVNVIANGAVNTMRVTVSK